MKSLSDDTILEIKVTNGITKKDQSFQQNQFSESGQPSSSLQGVNRNSAVVASYQTLRKKDILQFNFNPVVDDELTFDTLGSIMRDVDDEMARQFAKQLLRQFEREGLLVKLVLSLIHDDPKQFLHNVTDPSDFSRTKFGGRKKMAPIIDEWEIEVIKQKADVGNHKS